MGGSCLHCRVKGPWLCRQCAQTFERQKAVMEHWLSLLMTERQLIAQVSGWLVDAEDALSALSVAQLMGTCNDLLGSLESTFTDGPVCPICEEFRIKIVPGTPVQVVCVGGYCG